MMNKLDLVFLFLIFWEVLTFIFYVLLIIGALIAVKKMPIFYSLCLVIGSIMMTLSALARSNIFVDLIFVRFVDVPTIRQIRDLNIFFSPIAVFIFAIGFIGLSKKFRNFR